MRHTGDSRYNVSGRGKIISAFVILGCLGLSGYGTYMLIEAREDKHSDEANDFNDQVDIWDAYIPLFDNLNVTVSGNSGKEPLNMTISETASHDVKESGFDEFDRLKYFIHTKDLFSTKIGSYGNATYDSDDKHVYNYTSPLTVTIDSDSVIEVNVTVFKKEKYNLNQKMCNNHHTGVFEVDTRHCYYHYRVSAICLVVDQNGGNGTWGLVEEYQDGCGPDPWIEWETVVKTNTGSKFNPKKDLGEVRVYVRSINDPYLYYDESAIDASATALAIGGIIMIILATIVLIGTIVYLCRKPKLLTEVQRSDDYNLPGIANSRI